MPDFYASQLDDGRVIIRSRLEGENGMIGDFIEAGGDIGGMVERSGPEAERCKSCPMWGSFPAATQG